ncbi:RNA-binding domain-containing protein [Facilibium subflavum]|uniref:RNA-binding domain-containing protein n=1 Tax=Facilibium subflavum TaxID=2219058 RepID=UPI001AAD84B6|nr:RNA-binding domain-containing protein [Facilibium subflavum]
MEQKMNLFDEIKLGESKTLEFKRELPSSDKIAKTAIAFSNSSGGKLVIGVSDDRQIIGIDDANIFDLQDKIASIIFDNCSPNILPEIYTVNYDGKLLLVVEIFRGNLLPYFLKKDGKNNGTYIRVGATNRKAEYENIVELERQKRHISYDEEISYDVSLDTLDLKPLYERFAKLGKPLDEQKLHNLKLLKSKHGTTYPTNALLIILGYFENCTVKCARFKGVTMELFIDKKEYKGDIFTILENTQNFILNHINLRGEIKGLYRTDTYEIPEVALREALINALIHRDYINKGRDIKVGIYDDIVNIVSPGSFPNTITATDIANGRSEARNKVVANIFKELGLIEQWGSGINRIKKICETNSLKEPKIEEQNDFVDVEFFRPNTANKVLDIAFEAPHKNDYERLRTIANDCEQLTKEEQDILLYLLDNKMISRKEATTLIGLKNTKTYETLNSLVEKNLIIRNGQGRSTHYVLKRETNE